MPDSLRVQRGQKIMRFLMDNYPKAYDQDELATALGIPQSSISRILTARLVPSGQVEMQPQYKRTRYRYVKDAPLTISLPFVFTDKLPEEMAIWELCNEYMKSNGKKKASFSKSLMQAMMFGMACEDSSDRIKYIEFLDAAVTKLRPFMLAYRMAATLQNMPPKDRDLIRWAIQYRTEDFNAASLLAMYFVDLAKGIPEP